MGGEMDGTEFLWIYLEHVEAGEAVEVVAAIRLNSSCHARLAL